MTISWFPGHMHKARLELKKTLQDMDAVIEILDARAPAASSNPLISRLKGKQPTLRILNKCDLADPGVTKAWHQRLHRPPGASCLLSSRDEPVSARQVLSSCEQMTGGNITESSPMQAVILGIPNVGKSTLLNRIAGRKLAKTGNEPALTRAQQRIRLHEHFYLVDTPGLLWPRFEDQTTAMILAVIGSIRNTALNLEEVAWFLAELLLRDHYKAIEERFSLDSTPRDTEAFMTSVARTRGCIGKSGRIDWHRTSEQLVNDFRNGKLGRLSLETPDIIEDVSVQ